MNEQTKWSDINGQHLSATLNWLRLKLRAMHRPAVMEEQKSHDEPKGCWFKLGGATVESVEKEKRPEPSTPSHAEIEAAEQEIKKWESPDAPPALLIMERQLCLSTFERQVLSLCIAAELDSGIRIFCAQAQDDPKKTYPTFALALTMFDNPDWKALSPQGPLRYWRLVEIVQSETQALTAGALRVDERIIHYAKGLNHLDDRLSHLLAPLASGIFDEPLSESQLKTAATITRQLRAAVTDTTLPVIRLTGIDGIIKKIIAHRVAADAGIHLETIYESTLSGLSGDDLENVSRLWQRESLLLPLGLYIERQESGTSDQSQLNRFLERIAGAVFLDEEEMQTHLSRYSISFETEKPTSEEQKKLWTAALQDKAGDYPRHLAEQFNFNQVDIQRIALAELSGYSESGKDFGKRLWSACMIASRPSLEKLAQRIEVKAAWDDLVLPSEEKILLRQIIDQVRSRRMVYDTWGFREKMNRGLGINALFSGESGTGKTMAAEVIANELELDLYRIDLSAVVNKYIGETEKNLRKLFDAAEDGGAILFFDEADALFGKRSEVKDSHDRYANIEVNYLLQRMETYRGLAILATNWKNALDKAFVRRLRFIVNFPFPGIEERIEIWRKVFPADTPQKENLDFPLLARHNLTGGSIHNIALNAAFLAASNGGEVTMPLLLNAARTEFKKLEKPIKESDFQWHQRKETA
jgi:hypothetical protein